MSAPGWAESRTRPDPPAAADAQAALSANELEALMLRYQQADGEATGQLVERLSPMLLRFLAGPLQTRDYAEDMLQDCWMRIHRARHTYRPGSPLLPWIFAIARHTRIDAYRRRSQITRRELASDDLEAVGGPSVEQQPPSLDHGDLWKLVAELPESQQEVVKLLKVAGLSLEETARATGSTIGSVKQKAHRAYRKLREMLAAQGIGR